MPDIVSIILAAGQGVRMKSPLPKVLHEINGIPLVRHVLDPVLQLRPSRVVLVVGHGRDDVIAALSGYPVEFAVQEEQKGTGHAVSQADGLLRGYTGTALVLPGDVPLLRSSTLRGLVDVHAKGSYSATVLAGAVANPFGYGRIVKDREGNLLKIVEEKDATSEEKLIEEINSGIYCFEYPALREALSELKNDNRQGEYYITDTIAILRAKGLKVGVERCDGAEILGINTIEELRAIENKMRETSSGKG